MLWFYYALGDEIIEKSFELIAVVWTQRLDVTLLVSSSNPFKKGSGKTTVSKMVLSKICNYWNKFIMTD